LQIRTRFTFDLCMVMAALILGFGITAARAADSDYALADPGGGSAPNAGAASAGLGPSPTALPLAPFSAPSTIVESPTESENPVDWDGLVKQSLRFLAIMQGYRLATEAATQANLNGSILRNYFSALGNIHGWADGDEFYVNYVGHPMQGAASGYIWVHNDRKYREAEFGRNRFYWKGRLRAASFAWAYSEQFEIGPLSEAMFGAIQKDPPAQGLVDHVVSPSIGMGWMIAEDAIDQYIIKRIEAHTYNRMIRRLARAGLNPARSFANLMAGSYPWHRETRPGVSRYDPKLEKWLISSGLVHPFASPPVRKISDVPGPAPFELTLAFQMERLFGGGNSTPCLGGGGTAAFRISSSWQLVTEVSGCSMIGRGTNLSGDSLTYMMGPRWVQNTPRPLSTYVQVLLGGNKITEERKFPEEEALMKQIALQKGLPPPAISEYTEQTSTNGFAVSIGGGVQYKLNGAFTLHLADVSYRHSWISPLGARDYSNGLKLSSGIVIRWGTW